MVCQNPRSTSWEVWTWKASGARYAICPGHSPWYAAISRSTISGDGAQTWMNRAFVSAGHHGNEAPTPSAISDAHVRASAPRASRRRGESARNPNTTAPQSAKVTSMSPYHRR